MATNDAVLRDIIQEHQLDANFPEETLEKVEELLDPNLPHDDKLHDMEEKQEIVHEIEEDSPYPEVRAAVMPTDEPDLPINTFRMWFLGIFLTIVGSGVNEFFSLRYPNITISALVAQLISFPLGQGLAYILPTKKFNILGYEFSLNPGPFNIKEHTVITIMANVSFGSAYATDILLSQIHYYNADFGWAYSILLTVTTQVIGYGLAGATRRFLVYPAAMIWPSNLVYTALFNTLHREEAHKTADGSMSRYRFFLYALLGAIVWYWFPGYLFQALSFFCWACWIAPNNIIVNQLFGVTSGLGMSIITFDWAQIAFNGSPLVTPWWTEANVLAGFVFFMWILTPILYYTNTWNSTWFPISDNHAYDNTGNLYIVKNILNPDNTFNPDKYAAYSPLYLPTTFALAYGLSFAGLTSVIVHVFLYYRHDIVRQWRQARTADEDIHMKLMRRYPEVPDWWYYTVLIITFALSVFTIEFYDTKLPWWALIISLLISVVWTLPVGIIQAVTNQQPGLNVITEFVMGYMLPGRPIANVCFKTYGYISMAQALGFASDLKIGHYMKIPPRTLFWSQLLATIIGAIVQVAVLYWMLFNVSNICSVHQPDHFICPGSNTFFTASIIWGAIGPARIFGPGQEYSSLMWGFLVGAAAPIPFYFLAKKYPHSLFKYVNAPVFFAGLGNVPPATGINFTMWAFVGFIFQFVIRRRAFNWWSKYNYVLSAAMDSGLAISGIIIFFAVQYKSIEVDWWGNNIPNMVLDSQYPALNPPSTPSA
jgi:OPT family small oligopeptide transporter